MSNSIQKLLIDGTRPLIVLPALVKEIGLEEAIILQQLHWLLCDKQNGKVIEGKRWIYNTYDEWREFFPWMTARTLMLRFNNLEKCGAVESCQPEGGISRRKYYRILVGSNAQ